MFRGIKQLIDQQKATMEAQAASDAKAASNATQVAQAAGNVMPKAGADIASRAAPVARTGLAETNSAASKAYMKKGGQVSASKRADGIAKRGKTKGRFV